LSPRQLLECRSVAAVSSGGRFALSDKGHS
jgi:hypothetical protein